MDEIPGGIIASSEFGLGYNTFLVMELIFNESKTVGMRDSSSVNEGVLTITRILPKTLPIKNGDDDVSLTETKCSCLNTTCLSKTVVGSNSRVLRI